MTRAGVLTDPVARTASWLRGLKGLRRYATAILFGAVAALSLPPADFLPALWLSIPALIWQLEGAESRKTAFWLGWSFGFGFFAVSLYWLTFALFVAVDRYWWLIPFASNGLAAGLAIFWGLAALPVAAHFAWQLRSLDSASPVNALRLFRSNSWAGALVFLACAVAGT